jgi:hypothetical protein
MMVRMPLLLATAASTVRRLLADGPRLSGVGDAQGSCDSGIRTAFAIAPAMPARAAGCPDGAA